MRLRHRVPRDGARPLERAFNTDGVATGAEISPPDSQAASPGDRSEPGETGCHPETAGCDHPIANDHNVTGPLARMVCWKAVKFLWLRIPFAFRPKVARMFTVALPLPWIPA